VHAKNHDSVAAWTDGRQMTPEKVVKAQMAGKEMRRTGLEGGEEGR